MELTAKETTTTPNRNKPDPMNTMTLSVQHRNIPNPHPVNAWVEGQVLALARRRHIDAAHIRLTRFNDSSPAYFVQVHLVTPGPDVTAEARDHTLHAAASKVLLRLRNEIRGRESRQRRRARRDSSASVTQPPARAAIRS
jgi:ribosome-associated translation inhibitor RaiA